MITSTDLYLGTFLIICGFSLSLLNLRRLVKEVNASFPSVLISENVLLMCIGIAFVGRSIHEMNSFNSDMEDIEERIGGMDMDHEMNCNFLSVLQSYGPLIVSLVNSFISLIIDNYMHYRMVADVKKEDEGNTVQDFENTVLRRKRSTLTLFAFWKKYFSYLAVALQWIVPILIALSMYTIEVKESRVLMNGHRSSNGICMAMVDATNASCFTDDLGQQTNYSLELRNILPVNYIEAHEYLLANDSIAAEINSVIQNVYDIIANAKNDSITDTNETSTTIWRKPRLNKNCMRICYLDNKNLLLFMFVIAIVSYFVPITLSTVILTKIHTMDVKRHGVKTYVSRELLYNILFWTPVMFDTFLSLILCSYSMNGMRTSIFNVIANMYQAVKNFMNTKYFQDNSVKPI